MAKVLLLDSDEGHAKELARWLEQHKHSVAVYSPNRDGLNKLRADDVDFDIVILYMSVDRRADWEILDQIRRIGEGRGPGPMILCASRTYRGPQIELEIEKKGARLVYER